ncbi:MAG: DnaJ domain-containing protein [Thiovulaceae bacterium]|jgi:hypothetical protein|nr:DnaJ domain-containing protein [Sulfurimonadaceae bacterium]MDD3817677.1 DnaJ domain-containing protein [Sulfurimonadaceae bacterium]
MDIILTNTAIQIRLPHDSMHHKTLMHYAAKSFKNMKHYSQLSVVYGASDESIKIKYMIQWAYKIYLQNPNRSSETTYKKLSEFLHLPIYIVCENKKQVSQTLSMTVEHLGDNVLSITSNQYNAQVVKYFKTVFKDAVSQSFYSKTFRLTIRTQNDLLALKQILSSQIIADTRVTFITQSLNFKKLNQDQIQKEENAFEEKLQKCYKILGISNESSREEIQNNYKKMLKKYHPDRVYAEGEEVVELYTKRFQAIQKAYAMIQEHKNIA